MNMWSLIQFKNEEVYPFDHGVNRKNAILYWKEQMIVILQQPLKPYDSCLPCYSYTWFVCVLNLIFKADNWLT